MNKFFEVLDETYLLGKSIPITKRFVSSSGYTKTNNPVSNAIRACTYKDVVITVSLAKGIITFTNTKLDYVPQVYISESVKEWLTRYYENKTADPMKILFFQYEDDENENENDQIWIGISIYPS